MFDSMQLTLDTIPWIKISFRLSLCAMLDLSKEVL